MEKQDAAPQRKGTAKISFTEDFRVPTRVLVPVGSWNAGPERQK